MQGKLTVASLIAGIGAIVTLLFSFLTVAGVDGTSDFDTNAWSRQGPNILLTIPPLVALGLIVLIVLGLTGNNLTANVVTFTFDQLKAAFSVFAGLIMIFLLISDLGGASWAIGFWLMLLGSLAMAVGTIMTLLGAGSQLIGASSGGGGSAGAPQHPNQPYQTPPPQAPGGAAPPPPPGSSAPPPPPSGGTPPPPPPPNG